MRLINFTCRNLNSFLTREIDFFPDVSFLHGINGSGKTTVLRAIASLLTPDPLWLVNAIYDYVAVDLEHEGETLRIASLKSESGTVTVTISGSTDIQDSFGTDEIRFLSRIGDEDYLRLHDPDELAERSRLVIQKLKTLEFISGIPTPIFLGLDRTTLTPAAVARVPRSQRARAVHPYFRTQLDDAIFEAERLLARQLSVLSNERNKLFEGLRNKFVLSLFGAPNPNITLPKLLELADQFETKKLSIEYALGRIGIQPQEINSTVEPFFEEIKKGAVESRGAQKEYEKEKDQARASTKFFERISPLLNLAPSISIIESALRDVEGATETEKILSRPLATYKEIMDSFFGDSGKALVFEENTVRVRLPSSKITDLTSLSSGERQIFVLITHLIFNPAIRRENVLLIDEPELSLHLKWQRQFVTAIRQASPNTQMVLATHSPEIIFDRDDRLIELTIQ
jgi:predicted ATPase